MEASRQRDRVLLATPNAGCEDEFIAAVIQSEKLHHPWVFPPRTPEQYLAYLERIKRGRTLPNLLRTKADNRLVGVINISEPVMGVFQSAYLGFYSFAGCERQGLMTEGLALVLDRAFNELDFHRLEANIQPLNASSAALVRRLGFRKEGFSPKYLFIDGAWRDHDRWALLSEEWAALREQLFASR